MSVILEEKNDMGAEDVTSLDKTGGIMTENVGESAEKDLPYEQSPDLFEASEELPESPEVSEQTENIPAATERSASQIIMEDLEELIAEFPELSDLRDASELSDPIRYGKLRDLGLSPKEAYLATAGRKRIIDTRAHLSGAKPKPLNTPSNISAYAVRCVRELFDGISDEEIISLYRRVNS